MSLLVILGGTGSLGQAILKHQKLLKASGVKRIRVLSRDEQKQELLERSYKGDIPLTCFLGDVRDEERMIFGLKGAEYVIHAAALKMIDRFERDVPEGYKTNILGTMSVQQAVLKTEGLKKAMLVSTDKAADPLNAYGVSKLAAEKVWLWGNSFQKQKLFKVARYGNVFGSRGSVIEFWEKLARGGKSLPLTHKNMTRFFISLEKAAEFILKNLFTHKVGTFIPEMKAISMSQLAEFWNEIHDQNILHYHNVGIRTGEKMHECLTSVNDPVMKSSETAKRLLYEDIFKMHKEFFPDCPTLNHI